MRYLVDTNILSDGRKPQSAAFRWLMAAESESLFMSVVSLGEIQRGVSKKQRKDPAAAGHLSAWMHRTRRDYADRILPVTTEIALAWGRLSASRTRGEADALIAATALVHELILVTRNVADFADMDVPIVNPWSD